MAETGTGTLAVDLDGTLAEKQVPFNPYSVGHPVPKMLNRVRAELAKGRHVVCFTARASSNDPGMWRAVRAWLDQHGLQGMRITNTKTPDITEFLDDRAKQVVPDEGTIVGASVKEAAERVRKTKMVEQHSDHCPHCDHEFHEKGYPRPDFEQVEREGIDPMDADHLCPECGGIVDDPELTDEQIDAQAGQWVSKEWLLDRREKKRQRIAARQKKASSSPTGNSAVGRGRSLFTYVPTTALEAVKQHGLLSGNELAKPENRALLELARNADNDDSADAWLQRRAERLKSTPWISSYQGPSVFFGEPDPDRIHAVHPLKRFGAAKVRINLEALKQDHPDLKLHGVELVKFNEDYDDLTEDEKDQHVQARHHDLTDAELDELLERAMDAKTFWQHYHDPKGERYAGDVPHAQLLLDRIDPKYLSFDEAGVEKQAADERVHTHTKTMPDKSVLDIMKLIDMVKDREPHEVLLDDLDAPHAKNKATGFSEKRYAAANTAYPLLVGPGNYLIDGRHRYFKLRDAGATKTEAHALTQGDITAATLPQETKEAARDTSRDAFRAALNKAVAAGEVETDMQFFVKDDTCIVNAGDWHEKEQIAAAMRLAARHFGEVIEENECGRPDGYIPMGPSEKAKSEAKRTAKSASVNPVPTTGPMAIMHALKNIDMDALEKQARADITSGKITKRDKGVKMLGVIDGMRRNELDPTDLMITKVPVVPPAFRPYGMVGNTYLPGTANEMYGDLFKHRALHEETLRELGPKGAVATRRNLFNAVQALYGYGDPVSPKLATRGNIGFMKQLTGPGSPKYSFAQRNLFSKTQDNVARGAITVAPELSMNQIGIPREQLWNMYGSMVQGRLVRTGMSSMDAMKAVRDRSREADIALHQELKERPVIYSRAPAWHRFNTIAGWAQPVDGDNVAVNPLVTSGMNADFDGDTLNVHVPVLPDSVQEAKEKLMPDKMLFSVRDPDQVMPMPKHEAIVGLFEPQRRAAARVHKFSSKQEALAAMDNGAVSLSDDIEIPD